MYINMYIYIDQIMIQFSISEIEDHIRLAWWLASPPVKL